ncbi:hypothetical protein [Spirabiliibacterium falconis]|uniref:hypothetical protein n=1 Tax=Spirabiliibacterium falconis TaxID=572023 RepID=UPI001AAD62E3|nr:hypothetical protein [Spirabiliibacterium falconis]MBE2893463.1 hypothetical protein [Spirabiliibacterium falconis]
MRNSKPTLKIIKGGKKATSKFDEALAEIETSKIILRGFSDLSTVLIGKLNIIEKQLRGHQ